MKTAVIPVALIVPFSAANAEEPHVQPMKEFLSEQVMPWLSDPAVVNAIKAQNEKHAGLSEAEIDKLDKQWRAEVDQSALPLIESVLGNSLSSFLSEKKDTAQGAITEMFVMDNKGLNVGQSDVTSDYWQGDEGKWKKTYLVGPDAVFVDEIEEDESTQTLQSQASVAIKDPATGEVIGAITVAVDVDTL
ncbi:MAG: hypothetical protein AAGE89_14035 [Pseudomonadota bacterium]